MYSNYGNRFSSLQPCMLVKKHAWKSKQSFYIHCHPKHLTDCRFPLGKQILMPVDIDI